MLRPPERTAAGRVAAAGCRPLGCAAAPQAARPAWPPVCCRLFLHARLRNRAAALLPERGARRCAQPPRSADSPAGCSHGAPASLGLSAAEEHSRNSETQLLTH